MTRTWAEPKGCLSLSCTAGRRLLEEGLQKQAGSIDSTDDTYIGLLAALDEGWQIQSPVYARVRWGTAHAGQQMYHFVLILRQATRLFSVPDSPSVRTFLDDHRIAVNRQ